VKKQWLQYRAGLPAWAEYALALGAYCALGIWLLPQHVWFVNTDGISYLSLADHWLSGRWAHAVNGYWSPLLVWLLVPMRGLCAGLDAHTAAHIVVLASGAGPVLALVALGRRLAWPTWVRGVGLVVGVGFVLAAALQAVLPDVLSAGLVLWAVLVAFGGRWGARRAVGVGLLCALAYYAKAYNFFAVGAAWAAALGLAVAARQGWAVGRWARAQGLPVAGVRPLLLFGGVWLGLCAPWVAALSAKYGGPTVSTAGGYNLTVMRHWEGKMFFEREGLFAPPHPHAVSAWEDVSLLADTLYPPQAFAHRHWQGVAQGVRLNLHRVAYWAWGYRLAWLLPGLLAVWAVAVLGGARARGRALLGAGLVGLYMGGYVLALFEDRYVYPVQWCLWLLGAWATWQLAGWLARPLRQAQWVQAAVWLVWLGAALPGLTLWTRHALATTRFQYIELHRAAAQYHQIGLPLQGQPLAATPGHYHAGLELAYLTHARYYGTPTGATPTEWLPQLRRHGVRWLAAWHGPVAGLQGRYACHPREEIWLYDLAAPLTLTDPPSPLP
jgi:hypothetical protein